MTRSNRRETKVRRLATFPELLGDEPGAGGELEDKTDGVPTCLVYSQLEVR